MTSLERLRTYVVAVKETAASEDADEVVPWLEDVIREIDTYLERPESSTEALLRMFDQAERYPTVRAAILAVLKPEEGGAP